MDKDNAARLANVLMVEDSLPDIVLTKSFLDKENIHLDLTTVRDGDEALNYLRAEEELPDLVLLDLNLPRMHGFEVLREMRNDPNLQDISVVILSGSESPQDKEESEKLGISLYLVKPLSSEKVQVLVQNIHQLCLEKEGEDIHLCWITEEL